jgi:hypothetical protein
MISSMHCMVKSCMRQLLSCIARNWLSVRSHSEMMSFQCEYVRIFELISSVNISFVTRKYTGRVRRGRCNGYNFEVCFVWSSRKLSAAPVSFTYCRFIFSHMSINRLCWRYAKRLYLSMAKGDLLMTFRWVPVFLDGVIWKRSCWCDLNRVPTIAMVKKKCVCLVQSA